MASYGWKNNSLKANEITANAVTLSALSTSALTLVGMSSAASTLSGTQLDIEIDIGGTPYYFTVYPTKA